MGNAIIVNYHYIRDESTNGIRACSIERFREQLVSLKKKYKIVSVPDAYKAALENVNGNFCALTFDDGLVEHYKIAFNFLKQQNVTGTFFVIGSSLKEKTVPATHKLHLLLLKKSSNELADLFHAFFGNRFLLSKTIRLNPKRRFDDVLTSNLKESLIALPAEDRNSFIDSVFGQLYGDETQIFDELFMSAENVKEMHENGMTIGSHTYSHQALDGRDRMDQALDIERGMEVVSDIVNAPVKALSYPHGRYDKNTLEILEEKKFSWAVILGGRAVKARDHKFCIPRYDTNDI